MDSETMLDVGFYLAWNKSPPWGSPSPIVWLTLPDTNTHSAHVK